MRDANDVADAFMAGEWCAANRLHDKLHRIVYNNWMNGPLARPFRDGYRSKL
jgi:hypothetical protein